jgi:NAD(P) transhydrogenase subunit alpha
MRVKIGALTEVFPGENRVAMTPDSAVQLAKLGHSSCIQSGAGAKAGFSDAAYAAAGVEVLPDAAAVIAAADVIVKVRGPDAKELATLSDGQTLISFFWPAQNAELLEAAAKKNLTIVAMDMVPRISRAQKMDALSSMANIAGYRAVIEAGNNFGRFFTGQVTAAGKVPPAKVLIVGAGVAGLAAIGTSTSLGAITLAFDVRPEVAEQIESMGAEFVYLDFAEQAQDGAATGGYAAPSSPEFREAQLKKFRELAPDMDIVITTALIPGRPAPKLWTEDMVRMMKPGSVIVDLAVEQGGNVEGIERGRIAEKHGLKLIGLENLPASVPADASALYARNLFSFLGLMLDSKTGAFKMDAEDEIIAGTLVCADGQVKRKG